MNTGNENQTSTKPWEIGVAAHVFASNAQNMGIAPTRETTNTTVCRGGDDEDNSGWLSMASLALGAIGAVVFWMSLYSGTITEAVPFLLLSGILAAFSWMGDEWIQDLRYVVENDNRQWDALTKRIEKEENRRKEARDGE